jgi:hypothetical protein
MKKVKFNDKIKIIYVDNYKEYNRENCWKMSYRTEKIINFDNVFVKLFGFMMYYW